MPAPSRERVDGGSVGARGGAKKVGEPTPEVLVALFGDESRAAAVLADLAAREDGGAIALVEAVVVARDAAGALRWHVARGGAAHICARADIIAAMLGVDLPARAVVAGLTAACRPGAGGDDARRAFGERFVREVAPAVAPGGSLLIGVVEDRLVPEFERGLRGYHRVASGDP
jgi:hypothetical protein